ncbi:MAG: efflux RND transporter permease subunit, partial [Pseudomonadota bacterium]
MIINELALRRQVMVLVLLFVIVVVGLFCYLTLPRESEPDITIPYVFVITTYEGVAAKDIETLITIPLERKLTGIKDTEAIKSVSAEGISTVSIEFKTDVNIDEALRRVKDKVDEAKNDLPKDLEDDPFVKEVNFQDFPIIRVALSGPFSLKRLKAFAEDFQERFEGVLGVLEARIQGGLEREIHVEFDLDRIAAYNMPFSYLINSVTKSNVNMPGGSIDIGQGKYMVRVPEDFKHPAEIYSLVAYAKDGKPVYLRDVARITDSNKDPITRNRINGQSAVAVEVIKRSGENIVRVCDEIKLAVEEMRPTLPPQLKIDITSDRSKDVRLMVADLENSVLSGLILVLVVILIFIGGRSALFISLAIPYSMLMTFALLTAFNFTLNMVVLFSLILALGMLVDNGIVIVENIYRHMQMGESRFEASRKGTNEVAWPVITSTLTTLGAFVPMMFWPGIMGEFMFFLPVTVIMALSSSLFVALVINPVLSARWQTVKIKGNRSEAPEKPAGEKIAKVTETGLEPLSLTKRAYRRLLIWSLDHRLAVVFLVIILLVSAVFTFFRWGKGIEFFPDVDPGSAFVRMKAPVGTNLEASDKLVQQVEEIVSQYKDVEFVISNIGTQGGNIFSGLASGTHNSTVSLDFKDFKDRTRPSPAIVKEVRDKVLKQIKGAELQVEKEQHGPPTGAAVNLEVTGNDINILGQLAAEVRKVIKDVPGLVDLRDDYFKGKPEIRIQVDKEKAALMGLDTFTIAFTVKAAVNGVKVGVFREGKDEYDIVARLPEKDRRSLEGLKRLTVSSPDGHPVPITSLASFELTTGVSEITRKDQKRVITVMGDPSGRLANDIIKDIKVLLARMNWPKGYRYSFTGEQKEQQKAQTFLSQAFMAA